MTSSPLIVGSTDTKGKNSVPKARWPLSYCLQAPKASARQSTLQSFGFGSSRPPPRRWWSHRLYRGPGGEEVEILYSRNKAESEIIAQHFINEPVLGFDMEWPWNDWKRNDLQNKVGLIQIASETRIGLFHIGLHPGKTTDDIIAPTLRRIIETPDIGKVGVNILRADFGRLARFFGLKPKGAIESSHLHRLVKFGSRKPELVSIKMVSLAHQVEEQLGLPLFKGDVRTSNWSKSLSQDQINYAAADAYAGFMLYHCTNAKRLAMKPTPPLPVYAEKYPRGKTSRDDPILLDAGDGTTITTEEFFGVKPSKSGTKETKVKETKKTPPVNSNTSKKPLDTVSQALFHELCTRRATLAELAKLPTYRIISDALLKALARERPFDTESLVAVKGIGKIQQKKYGDAWLEVISLFLATNGLDLSSGLAPLVPSTDIRKTALRSPKSPPCTPRHAGSKGPVTPDSSPAFDTPLSQTPSLHTGLSFTMVETRLSNGEEKPHRDSSSDSDESLLSLDFGTPPRRTSSQLKRKRTESPTKRPTRDDRHDALKNLDISNQPSNMPLENTTPIYPAPTSSPSTKRRSPPQLTVSPSTLPFSPPSRLARNKLSAFSKLVTRNLPERPANAPPIVTEHTLDLIITLAPQTQDDLERIPGIDSFLLASEQTGTELLRNVVKFIGTRG